MGEFNRIYFLNSTLILYLSSSIYVLMIMVWEVESVSIFFSFLYSVQLLSKYGFQDSIYWSPYFNYGFVMIDILSGPIAFGFSIDNAMRKVNGIHLGCVLIISKVITCRLNIKIVKQLYYIFKATLKYFRLSLSLALCFIVTSYFIFQPYTKFFRNLGQTFYSMYQLCTFDGWIKQSAKQIIKNSSSYWLLYFAVYFIIITLCYLIAILSFFMIYYSTEQLQQNFEYQQENFVRVKDLANKLGLKNTTRKRLIVRAQIIIVYFTIVSILQWIWPQIINMRPLFIVGSLLYSISYLYYRLTKYGWSWNLSHYLLLFRGVFCTFLFSFTIIFDLNVTFVLGMYLFSCVIDLIRHNNLLQIVLKRYYKNIVQYLIILSSLCYFFSVMLYQRKTLTKISSLNQSFFDLYLLNIQVIGFDSWGEKAHAIIQQNMKWVWCLIIMVFVGAMTVSNMFLGQILLQMTPYIKQILKVQKLYHTKLYCNNVQQFQQLCKKEIQKEIWKKMPAN